jgi:ATP-dependent RNA helicase RhlE
MPVTEFYKPNPLDSDVIMDATARLLAPRRSAAPAGHTHRARQSEGRKQTRPVHARAEQADGQHGQEQKRGQQKKQAPAKSAQTAHTADKESALPAKKKKRRRNDRPRPIERSLYARQKDSTEQESLMRPYYMNHDD